MNFKSALRTSATVVIVLGFAVAAPGLRSASAQRVDCPGASCDVVRHGDGQSRGTDDRRQRQRAQDGEEPAERHDHVEAGERVRTSSFAPDSIKPHVGAPTSGKQTTTQAAWDAQIQFQNSNATQYRVKNANSAAATLYYDVKVYHKATGAAHRLDPAILNDP